jgi:hypothetical protein
MGKAGFYYLLKAAEEYGKGYRAMTMKSYWMRLITVSLHNHIGQAVQILLHEFIQGKPHDQEEEENEAEVLEEMEHGVKHAPIQ